MHVDHIKTGEPRSVLGPGGFALCSARAAVGMSCGLNLESEPGVWNRRPSIGNLAGITGADLRIRLSSLRGRNGPTRGSRMIPMAVPRSRINGKGEVR